MFKQWYFCLTFKLSKTSDEFINYVLKNVFYSFFFSLIDYKILNYVLMFFFFKGPSLTYYIVEKKQAKHYLLLQSQTEMMKPFLSC